MTSKRQKQAGYLLPKDIDGYALKCLKIPVPDAPEYRAAVLGAIFHLTKWYAWEKGGAGDRRATKAAAYWRELLKDIEVCDCDPCIQALRYKNGKVQAQIGGVWTDLDSYTVPNTGGGDYFPPPSPRPVIAGQDTKCLAAANAANTIKLMHADVVKNFQSDFIMLAASSLVAVLAVSIFFPPSIPVVLSVLGTATTILGALTLSSFTSDIFDDLVCLLKNNATVNGSNVVTFNFSNVLSTAAANGVTSSMWAAIAYYLQIIQEGGLNLAGATTAISSYDCSICLPDPCAALTGTASIVFPGSGFSNNPPYPAGVLSVTGAPPAGGGQWYTNDDGTYGLSVVTLTQKRCITSIQITPNSAPGFNWWIKIGDQEFGSYAFDGSGKTITPALPIYTDKIQVRQTPVPGQFYSFNRMTINYKA